MKKRAGFTVVEVMVVVAVIGILAAVILSQLNGSTAVARDAERKADLRAVQSALELYKNKYGRYPEGCNAASWTGNWSGEIGTDYACSDGSREYIKDDLTATAEVENFSPQFIPVLPTDPKVNGTNSGYVYTTNPDGTVYKLMALNTVEAEIVTNGSEGVDVQPHPLSRCGKVDSNNDPCATIPSSPTGNMSYGSGPYQSNDQCDVVNQYSDDYAVFGGYAPRGFQGIWRDSERAREYFTDVIHCK